MLMKNHSFACYPHFSPQIEWAIRAFNFQLQSIAAFGPVPKFTPWPGKHACVINLLRVAACMWNVITCWSRDKAKYNIITFRMRHSRGKMYIGHVRLCVCPSLTAFPHYCMDPDVTWGNGRECPVVVHYWADLQSVHGFRCYDNIAPNTKCQRVLVLALWLLCWVVHKSNSGPFWKRINQPVVFVELM